MTVIGASTHHHSVTLPGEDGAAIVLSWALDTHTGYRRRHNEDSVIATPPIFAVADGMGGHSAGDVASKAVVTRLHELGGAGVTTAEAINAALKAATVDISFTEDQSQLGVGTTVTGIALVVQDDQPCWAVFNVGDSRVYLLERNKLVQVTVDHSVVQELVDAGMISASEAEHHPDSNIITRAVGFNADPKTDFWLIPVRAGTRLLICSDGLTKEVDNNGIRQELAAGRSAEQSTGRLIDAALAAGGRDNVTVLIVDVLESPTPEESDD